MSDERDGDDEARAKKLAALRREYAGAGLLERDAPDDPIEAFVAWFAEAEAGGVIEPNAMTLATATPDGAPSARVVLLKGVDRRGFVFFTNYESRKGADLSANARAALVFFWRELERQVRVEGEVERVSAAESDAYFASRPRGSRLGAVASPQSQVVASRADLDEALARADAKYAGDAAVPRPAGWGGYRVVPARIELWQGRPNRMHDRLLYSRAAAGDSWLRQRLGP